MRFSGLNSRLLVLFTLVLALTGCATEAPKPHFVDSPNQTLAPPPPDKAQIVFLEPINGIQGLFPIGLFELEGEQRTLLAATGAHSKVAVLFTPGRHTLMANQSGMMAHFMEANVEAGKRYYVLLRFVYGNGFQLRPLRTSTVSNYNVVGKDFPNWVAETRFVDKTPDSDAFYEKYKDNIDKSQAAGWKNWLAKSPQERAELTLTPQDAVAP